MWQIRLDDGERELVTMILEKYACELEEGIADGSRSRTASLELEQVDSLLTKLDEPTKVG